MSDLDSSLVMMPVPGAYPQVTRTRFRKFIFRSLAAAVLLPMLGSCAVLLSGLFPAKKSKIEDARLVLGLLRDVTREAHDVARVVPPQRPQPKRARSRRPPVDAGDPADDGS